MMKNSIPLWKQLKEQTRHAHSSIDQHPLLRPLVSPHITQHEYTKALAALHAFYNSLESALQASISINQVTFKCSKRSALLEKDLLFLGGSPYPDSGSFLAVQPKSSLEAIGVAYVLEGSQVGGQLIYGKLKSIFPEMPFNFFGASGSETRNSWKEFQQFLLDIEAHVTPQPIIDSACKVFQALHRHLDVCLLDGKNI